MAIIQHTICSICGNTKNSAFCSCVPPSLQYCNAYPTPTPPSAIPPDCKFGDTYDDEGLDIQISVEKVCTDCKGVGKITLFISTQVCKLCNGSGKIYV